ncbi:MAG TPA: cytochrome c [Anaerolineae bacterium]|nr:cytochrome c [Anaerolineae bacterium]
MKALTLLLVLLWVGCAGASAATPAHPAPADTAAESIERGRVLFRDKGCVTCHVNNRVEGKTGVMNLGAPNLTDYTNEPEFLRRWLADPAAVKLGARMPNLQLSETDIADLIAFLNEPR